MTTQTVPEQVRWQDLKVESELDIVLEIARSEGWDDCEFFGHGDMITEPQDSDGWKLIPANLYKNSIPPDAVARLHQIINAGIRVQGVIIADDERRTESTPAPVKPIVLLAAMEPVLSSIREAFLGFVNSVRAVASFSGRVLLGLLRVVTVIGVVAFVAAALIQFWPVGLLGLLVFAVASSGTGTGVDYDPKLVILVDDGRGGTAWVSLFTWYD